MNATLLQEPFRLPAAILAGVVHALFFGLLYFGFAWQNLSPQGYEVELWQSLPEPVMTPAEPPVPVEPVAEAPPASEPAPASQAEIVLPDKKKRTQPAENQEPEPQLPKIMVQTMPPVAIPVVDPQVVQAERERQEKISAEKRMVDEYTAKIMAKIRSNIVEKPGIDKRLRTEFLVTLLPGGAVLSAKLHKPSGDAQYDDAVERAILKAQPLPLPADVSLFRNFRELKLGFTPEQ
jgi:colicin import membrane protein